MANFTKEELLAKIEALELEQSENDIIVAKINAASEIDNDLVAWVKERVQKQLDNAFAEAGVVDDETDPEYQKHHNQMMSEIDTAESNYKKEMEKLNEETDEIVADTSKQLDNIDLQSAQDKINGI